MDSFKDLLTETVGQIKRANEYFAEQQMKEIKKLKYSEPHPRQWERRRPPQVYRCNPSLLCQTFLFFAFSSTQCRDLFCLWKAFLLPDDGQAKHPKRLH
ncbi:unnamed protein product, partial [Porites evermanni]